MWPGTTVGYGDVTPHTVLGLWLNVLFVPISVIFISGNLQVMAENLVQVKKVPDVFHPAVTTSGLTCRGNCSGGACPGSAHPGPLVGGTAAHG